MCICQPPQIPGDDRRPCQPPRLCPRIRGAVGRVQPRGECVPDPAGELTGLGVGAGQFVDSFRAAQAPGEIEAGAGAGTCLLAGQAGEIRASRRGEHLQGVGGIDLVTGATDVSREQPYVVGAVPIDGVGEPGVQPPPHHHRHQVVRRLGEHRMHDPVPEAASSGVFHDEAGGAQAGDPLDEVVGHVAQEDVLNRAATHGEHVKYPSRGRRQRLDSAAEQGAHERRYLGRRCRTQDPASAGAEEHARLDQPEDHRADEERDAPGPAYQHLPQRGRSRTVEHRSGEVPDRCHVQPGELNRGQRLGALQRRDQLAQLLVDLVGAVRDEEQAALPGQRPRGRGRPVKESSPGRRPGSRCAAARRTARWRSCPPASTVRPCCWISRLCARSAQAPCGSCCPAGGPGSRRSRRRGPPDRPRPVPDRPVDRTRTLFGQVMWYVAATAGLFALGAFLGRNLGYGVAFV